MSTVPNLTKLLILIALCSHRMDIPAYAQTPTGLKGFCVHGGGIVLPVGKFLLIRKGNQVGGLRLTRIVQDTKTQPSAGEWLGTVDYESYFADGGHSLSDISAARISDKLRFARIRGFGFHYSWQSGNVAARVGPWKFDFYDEDGMFMTVANFWNGINHDSGLEFAPTGAASVAEINSADPQLHWFHYDNNADMPCPIAVPPPANTDTQTTEKDVHVQ